MKAYIKPTMEVIELKPEERLAKCGQPRIEGKTLITILFLRLIGSKCIPCRTVNYCSSGES